MVENSGGAEVVVWRDGRKVGGIAAPWGEGGPEVRGEVPAHILDEIERNARDWGEDGDPAYFSAICGLATELTGYECGSGLEGVEGQPFEILDTPENAEVLSRFPDALANALAAKGFTSSLSLDRWRRWYTADTPVPGLTAVVAINLDRSHSDGIRLTGWVSIVSPTVARVCRACRQKRGRRF